MMEWERVDQVSVKKKSEKAKWKKKMKEEERKVVGSELRKETVV